MKKIFTTALFATAFIFVSANVLADSVVASYNCKVKEGKTIEDVQAKNSVWLKWVRANINKDIKSEVGTAIVGTQNMFLFVDTYPDLTVWAATATALDSDQAIELKDLFDEVSDCSENKLWKFKPTM
jgi:hypothetical protein